jgi:hypothetical protein
MRGDGWWLLFAISLDGKRLWVCIDEGPRYKALSGPHDNFKEAFASMDELRNTNPGKYR